MRKTKAEKKRQLIDGLIAGRQSVLNAALALPVDRQDEIFLGEWSVKDLLAHLVGWDFTNIQAIREILDGQAPTFLQYFDKDWRSFNRKLVEQYRREPLQALLAEVQASHQEFMAFLDALPAEELLKGKARSPRGRPVTIQNLLRVEARDEQTHAEQVKMYLDSST